MILPCPAADPYTMLMTNVMTNNDGNGHMNCTIANCDCRNRTVPLGLQMGRTYEIAVFHADRHPTESNYQLTLSGFATNRTTCTDLCGNGVVKGAEECDCGSAGVTSSDPSCMGMNNGTAEYGGCTTACKYGPYCGDGIMNGPEQCDNGAQNAGLYGQKGACTRGCTWARYCGDTIVDEGQGEQCDLGESINGTPGARCSAVCMAVIQ
jgi:hypothetical protein